MQRHCKKKITGFKDWEQLNHDGDYLIYPENIRKNLSIDELSLSKGELYTFVTNKRGRGKKNTIVAVIKGTKSKDIIDVLHKIPLEKRKLVQEVTLDMVNNMQLTARMYFPESNLVTDRFYIVKLVMEALQYQRIKLRWEAIEKESLTTKHAKEFAIKYISIILENDDTPKQLLARNRYIIAKKQNQWTTNQNIRAELLFKNYPLLHQAFKHALELINIYEQTSKEIAKEQIIKWIEKTKHYS